MRVYIIEYRYFDKTAEEWRSKVSQEGYTSIEAAQKEIERRVNEIAPVTPMLYQTADGEEYAIHDILIVEPQEAATPPTPRPYERTRAAVYATGNKWAIENFNATHG